MLVCLVNADISSLVEQSQCHLISSSARNPLTNECADVGVEHPDVLYQTAISIPQNSTQSSPDVTIAEIASGLILNTSTPMSQRTFFNA